jgi:hypothetical protein
VWEAALYSRAQVSKFQGFKVSEVEGKDKDSDGREMLLPTLAAQKTRVEGGAPVGGADSTPTSGCGGSDPTSAEYGRCGAPASTSPLKPKDGLNGPPEGALRLQEFVCANGTEAQVEMTAAELERKRAMWAQYASQQGEFLQRFDLACEVVRPQVRYDYKRAPHEGRTNYECWEWWMSAREVSARFAEFVVSGR